MQLTSMEYVHILSSRRRSVNQLKNTLRYDNSKNNDVDNTTCANRTITIFINLIIFSDLKLPDLMYTMLHQKATSSFALRFFVLFFAYKMLFLGDTWNKKVSWQGKS
uniref:Uncharacterized protein n=1 Tax=Glossina brevipalpis TaxID=37001 RepID=A0A1A9WTQ3_9MUSC